MAGDRSIGEMPSYRRTVLLSIRRAPALAQSDTRTSLSKGTAGASSRSDEGDKCWYRRVSNPLGVQGVHGQGTREVSRGALRRRR